MNDRQEEQKREASAPSVESIIQHLFEKTGGELTRIYERLKWLGYFAVVGSLIIVSSFVLAVIPGVTLPLRSQVLFVLTGFAMLLLSAVLYALQNVHAFRLEDRNRDMTIRSLELKYDLDKAIALKPVENPQGGYTAP